MLDDADERVSQTVVVIACKCAIAMHDEAARDLIARKIKEDLYISSSFGKRIERSRQGEE